MVRSKCNFRRIWYFFDLNGVWHVSEHRDVLKRHSLESLLSLLLCFFWQDSLFWHWKAKTELGDINSGLFILRTIDLDMPWSENCSFSVMHWDIIMSLVSNESSTIALDNDAYTCRLLKSCVAMKISHWQNGLPQNWDTLYHQCHSS